MNYSCKLLWLLIFSILNSSIGYSQYFGRNKVQYESFDFKQTDNENFRIYFYPAEQEAAFDSLKMLEGWRDRFSRILDHELRKHQPIILYANHADFQQTNVISGIVSQGTGGLTEGVKNRIVLPLTGIYKNNNHVLGHELVHAFQFDILRGQMHGGQSLGTSSLPLWFIEGMAEYFSIGPTDPLTEMWLRDAVLNQDLPGIDDLSRNAKYFPYRWGHAVWAYIGDRWGTGIAGKLFRDVSRMGWESGVKKALKIDSQTFTEEWHSYLRKAFRDQIAERTIPADTGRPLLEDDSGLNLAPAISPDGTYVAHISQRDIFTLDLFLTDVHSGRVVRKLVSSNTDAHFDALRFMNSAGAWSPDGDEFAFVVFKEGDNQIAVLNLESGQIRRKIEIPDVDAISDLAWSPDGHSIAFFGTSGGRGDLYVYNLSTEAVQQLTQDRFAEFQPSWSPDGRKIVFATDRGEKTDFDTMTFGPIQIGIFDLESEEISLLSMPGATKHISPYYSPDGLKLFFVADPEGVSDIYCYRFGSGDFVPITDSATGVSGLTSLSPAMSMASKKGDLVFTVFDDTKYYLRALSADAIERCLSEYRVADGLRDTLVENDLHSPPLGPYQNGLESDEDEYSWEDYHPSLQLMSFGYPGIGVAVDRYGTSLGGGASFMFSDTLGDHLLGVTAQANGGFKDLGGQAFYLNRKNRLNWGGVVGHIPYLTAWLRSGIEEVELDGKSYPGYFQEMIYQRVFIDRMSIISEYPLSSNRRLEFGSGYNRLSYDVESERIVVLNNQVVDYRERDLPSPDPLNLFQSSVAYVGDYSFFGFTSPVRGKRFRLELEPVFGSVSYLNALVDYRHYFFKNPFSFAFRIYHNGRYSGDSESGLLTPLFVGYNTLVRGYEIESFDLSECSATEGETGGCPEIERLIGSRIGVLNAEIRLPLLGSKDYGVIDFPYLPVELAAFFDAGVAWTRNESPKFTFDTDSRERIPVTSAGVAARVNLFGYLVAQFYYASPFQRPDKSGQFGFVISPGW